MPSEEEKVKKLMTGLGEVINKELSESLGIRHAISLVKQQGYDIALLIEITVGFQKNENREESKPEPEPEVREQMGWTIQDKKFLKTLKIRGDE